MERRQSKPIRKSVLFAVPTKQICTDHTLEESPICKYLRQSVSQGHLKMGARERRLCLFFCSSNVHLEIVLQPNMDLKEGGKNQGKKKTYSSDKVMTDTTTNSVLLKWLMLSNDVLGRVCHFMRHCHFE